jgi:hypothetical protein
VIVSDNPLHTDFPSTTQQTKTKNQKMNNTLHTPAPWKHDPTWGIIKHGKSEICALHSGNLANAHLISTAPDLLQVVADYVLLCDLHDYVGAVPDAAREALRKAKGEA